MNFLLFTSYRYSNYPSANLIIVNFLLSPHICTEEAVLLREIKKYRHFLMKRRYLSCPLALIFPVVTNVYVFPLVPYYPAYHGVWWYYSVCPVLPPFSVSERLVCVANSTPFAE